MDDPAADVEVQSCERRVGERAQGADDAVEGVDRFAGHWEVDLRRAGDVGGSGRAQESPAAIVHVLA